MDADIINQRLLFVPQAFETDTLILLGAKSVSGEIARAAAEKLVSGEAEQVILSGGNGVFEPWIQTALKFKKGSVTVAKDFWSAKKEADYMQDVLLSDPRIREDQILAVEDRATNTGQNFENIRGVIEAHGITNAAVMCVAYTQRRAVETAARVVPDLQVHPVPVYPYGIEREDWLSSWEKVPLINGVVRGEFAKVSPDHPRNYYEQGFCTPVDIPTREM